MTPEPGGFQGIHFEECLCQQESFPGVPAVSAASSGAHSLSALGFQTPPRVPLPPPDPCSRVGGLDPPPELISVLSPLPQSLLNQPSLLLVAVPVTPLCLPHPWSWSWSCRGCSEQLLGECVGWGCWAWAAEHEMPVRESLGEGMECSELCSLPSGWERAVNTFPVLSSLGCPARGWIHPQQ